MKTEKISTVVDRVKAKKMSEEELLALKNRPIDFSDIPEITDFSGFRLRNWKPVKKPVSLRIDCDILAWLKRKGDGYQQRTNDVIRWAMQNNCPCA